MLRTVLLILVAALALQTLVMYPQAAAVRPERNEFYWRTGLVGVIAILVSLLLKMA